MISVIVPVYNVESYLQKCIDSILAQTYKDLEILLIDDGSTDNCGRICDGYKDRDQRVQVFHTENRGLSAARNVGLNHARGEYIAFVDSDDWIESDMIEVLYHTLLESGKSIVACGFFNEYDEGTIKTQYHYYGGDALVALLNNEFGNMVWNKLWKASCFLNVRFPEGLLFEDIVVSYQIIASETITVIQDCNYHYTHRKESISESHDLKNILDYWIVHRDRFERCNGKVNDKGKRCLLKSCAYAISRAWVWERTFSKRERAEADPYYREMQTFVRRHFTRFGDEHWSLDLRIGVFLAGYRSTLAFAAARALRQVRFVIKQIKLKNKMEKRRYEA